MLSLVLTPYVLEILTLNQAIQYLQVTMQSMENLIKSKKFNTIEILEENKEY